jgi:hypothetical protein
MRKRKRKARYSAKPGQIENLQAKDYTEPKLIADSGWIKNPFGIEERTTITKNGDRYDVEMQMQGALFLPPLKKANS